MLYPKKQQQTPGDRVQPSHGIAGFSSRFAAPVLQARMGGAASPFVTARLLKVREVAERLGVSTATRDRVSFGDGSPAHARRYWSARQRQDHLLPRQRLRRRFVQYRRPLRPDSRQLPRSESLFDSK